MQKWVYMSIVENLEKNEAYLNFCSVPGELIIRTYSAAFMGDLFNKIGKQGWEMIGFTERNIPYTRVKADSHEERVVEYLFKKQIIDEHDLHLFP